MREIPSEIDLDGDESTVAYGGVQLAVSKAPAVGDRLADDRSAVAESADCAETVADAIEWLSGLHRLKSPERSSALSSGLVKRKREAGFPLHHRFVAPELRVPPYLPGGSHRQAAASSGMGAVASVDGRGKYGSAVHAASQAATSAAGIGRATK